MLPIKQALMELLSAVDNAVPAQCTMTLVGAGDTAMALLDLKPPAIHLDFTGPDRDIAEFSRLCANVPLHGFQIHTWTNGIVFGQHLPEDYLKASLKIGAGLAKVDLRALQPLDVVVTRIERLSDADMRDIKTCIKHFRLGKNQILKRARALQQVGNEEKFERNLDIVLSLYA